MAWKESSNQARVVAERRLAGLARDWLPPAAAEEQPAWPVTNPHERRRLVLDGWGRPALRGLALLVAVVLAIAAYGVWLGRPRAVAEAPARIEAGAGFADAPVDGGSAGSPPASGVPVPSAAATATAPVGEVVVHVVGEVRRPGVVRLPVGARVEDAVEAAGGVRKRRAADSVNLARVLVDGEQVVVSDQEPTGMPTATGPTAAAVVDLNTATVDALDGLPGIGPVIAARIIAWRTANGPFRSVDELGEVSGIGDAILGQIRSLVRV